MVSEGETIHKQYTKTGNMSNDVLFIEGFGGGAGWSPIFKGQNKLHSGMRFSTDTKSLRLNLTPF